MYSKQIPVHLFKTIYIFSKSDKGILVETFVDDEALKRSGYSSVDDFILNLPEDNESGLKSQELHFSLYYFVHIPKVLNLIRKMKVSSYANFLIHDKNSKSIYLYIVYREED